MLSYLWDWGEAIDEVIFQVCLERKSICLVNKRGQEGLFWQKGQLELPATSVSEVRNILCLII